MEEAIADMKEGIQYESKGPKSGARARIDYKEKEGSRPYLKMDGDEEKDNNLDNLPHC